MHPQPETYRGNVNPTGPRACYDEGKRAAETLSFDYDRMGKAVVRVCRIFNTYGPRLSAADGRVVATTTADRTGAGSFTWPVPPPTRAGEYEVVVTGSTSDWR